MRAELRQDWLRDWFWKSVVELMWESLISRKPLWMPQVCHTVHFSGTVLKVKERPVPINAEEKNWETALPQFSSGVPGANEGPQPAAEPASTSSLPTPPKSPAPDESQPWLSPSPSLAGVCLFPSEIASCPWPFFSSLGLSLLHLFFFWMTIKIHHLSNNY